MIICKECRCFHPITVSDRYCGECCIGDTRNPIAINADITGCCLFEPKQPKKPKPMTNADRIRQMAEEELASVIGFNECKDTAHGYECPAWIQPNCDGECKKHFLAWLKQEMPE